MCLCVFRSCGVFIALEFPIFQVSNFSPIPKSKIESEKKQMSNLSSNVPEIDVNVGVVF